MFPRQHLLKPPTFLALRLLSSSSVRSKSIFDIGTKVIANSDKTKYSDNKYITHPAFPHPKWTDEQVASVSYEHRPPKTAMDRFVFRCISTVRTTFDLVTGYKKPRTPEEKEHRFKGTRWEMTESKWLTRVIFLESVAGVPGMTAAFLRHLHSLRLMKRDKAWIETLLDEAYNERMHLLTFMKIGRPSWFTKVFVFAGQGVFCNLFFLMYLLLPRACHRFVGYLEEEAVSTYTHLIEELEAKRLPKFDGITVPEVAQLYWPELNEKSTFLDLIQRIRADESKHREVNHTLANLDQKEDRNPYAMQLPDVDKPQPTNDLKGKNRAGWERKDLIV